MNLPIASRFELLLAKLRSHSIELKAYDTFIRQMSSDRQLAIAERLKAERIEIGDEYLILLGELMEDGSVPMSLLENARRSIEASDAVLMEVERIEF